MALQSWIKQPSRWVIALAILLIIYLIGAIYLPSLVYQNLGWLYLAQGKLDMRSEMLADARTNFAQALAWNPHNRSAWRGQALSAAYGGQQDVAITSWANAKLPPEQVLEYGLLQRGEGEIGASLITFQSALPLYPRVPNAAGYAAGNVCQSIYADLDSYPIAIATYCRGVVAENDNNLLVNPQFVGGDGRGWSGDFRFGHEGRAELVWMDGQGHPPPSAAIIGKTDERHFGLYQRVCLSPGTTVRFSGWFRVKNDGAVAARLLYIGWQQDGRPAGNQARIVQDDMNWSYVAREFTLPLDALPNVLFSPVDLAGHGTAWFDDLRLEVINLPPAQFTQARVCR